MSVLKPNTRFPLNERAAAANSAMAGLQREFKKRLEQLEHEHVMRLMATFQEFKARAFAIKNGKPMNHREVLDAQVSSRPVEENGGGERTVAARPSAGTTAPKYGGAA